MRTKKQFEVEFYVSNASVAALNVCDLSIRSLQDQFDAFRQEYPDLPILSEQRLCLQFDLSGKLLCQTFDLKDSDTAEDLRCFMTSKPDATNLKMCFRTTVSIKTINKTLGNKTLVCKYDYFSWESPLKFLETINEAFVKLPVSQGKTVELVCRNGDGLPFDSDSINKFRGACEYELIISQSMSSYSKASQWQVTSKVDLALLEEGQKVLKSDTNSNTRILSAFEKSIDPETSLSMAIAEARATIQSAAEDHARWTVLVKKCVDELCELNQHVMHADVHSEAARRLVINEIVKKVVAFNGGTFYVGEYQNRRGETDSKFLGWGPLDFSIANLVVGTVVDPSDEELTDGGAASQPVDASAKEWIVKTKASLYPDDEDDDDDDDDDDDEDNIFASGGAKKSKSVHCNAFSSAGIADNDGEDSDTGSSITCSDSGSRRHQVKEGDAGLWQNCAQGYDRLMQPQFEDADRVSVVLCTGQVWKHFVLFRTQGKALLVYYGQVSMKILRDSYSDEDRLPLGKRRRPSCCCKNEKLVPNPQLEKDVEEVMLALHCTMNQKLKRPSAKSNE